MARGVGLIAAVILSVAVSFSDAGVEQTQAAGPCPVDVVLVIDRSFSLGVGGYTKVKNFAKQFVSRLTLSSRDARVGVIVFNDEAEIQVEIGDYVDKTNLEQKIDRLPAPAGGTNIYKALVMLQNMFQADHRFDGQAKKRFVAVVITDGKDEDSRRVKAAADAVHAEQIDVISIGFGNDIDQGQLNDMASVASYRKPTVDDLPHLVDDIEIDTCEDKCYRTSYTPGQLWLQDRHNCHKYIVCEPTGDGKYIRHLMTCGALFWNQKLHSCHWTKTGDRTVGPVVDYYGTTGDVDSNCNDDLLLHFDFENGFIDVSCHNAFAEKSMEGAVTLLTDANRGKVAKFENRGYLEVPFLNTWFATNKVDKFTVSLWYKIFGDTGALVNNGNSVVDAGFSLRVDRNVLISKIRTVRGQTSLMNNIQATATGWHHVAYVYDGSYLTTYMDGEVRNTAISGYLVNNNVPMYVGFENARYFFQGLMDELRIYTRALTPWEVAAL